METGRHLGMEEGATASPIKIQEEARVPTCELRALVPTICIDDQRLEEPNPLAGKTNELQAFAISTSDRHDNVGGGTYERHRKFENAHLPADSTARSVAQKVQHDVPQLEAEGVRSVTVAALFALLETQEYRCALSGRQLTPENVVIDHINPFSICNEHSIDNVQLLVSEANKAKGCMSNESFIELCRDVAARHPPGTGLLDSSAA